MRLNIVNTILLSLTGLFSQALRVLQIFTYLSWAAILRQTPPLAVSMAFAIVRNDVYDARLITRRRITTAVLLLGFAILAGWGFWNRPTRSDMASYVPADCLAFIESNDLVSLAEHLSGTNAWKTLAAPIGANNNFVSNGWLARLAKWTGFGSSASVILARSQVAVVFTDAQTTQTGTTLTVKPVAALIIETHTNERRMRPVLEKAVSDYGDRVIGPSVRQERQVGGVSFVQWSSQDGRRRISMTTVGTAAIISNDESLLLRCVNVRRGTLPSLANNQQLVTMRDKVEAARASLFGFIPNSGIKPILQAWLLSQPGASEESLTVTRLFADAFGNLIDGLAWSSKFADAATEDHCFASLSSGVADQIRSNFAPESKGIDQSLAFVPSESHSVSVYQLRDAEGFWRDLNATVSSHADALAAIASRPFLRGLIRPYGIEDADAFARAIGPQFATVRLDPTSRSVLITEAFDRQTLRKLAQQRLGDGAKTETIGDAELMLAKSDDWAAAFADNHFLIGSAEPIRHCLQAKAQAQSIATDDHFKRAQQLIDVSLPINIEKFTDDRQSAISFVELFSQSDRPTFSSNGESVDKAARTLPYAVSVTILKGDGFDWTARSSFGLLGSLFVYLAPEKAR